MYYFISLLELFHIFDIVTVIIGLMMTVALSTQEDKYNSIKQLQWLSQRIILVAVHRSMYDRTSNGGRSSFVRCTFVYRTVYDEKNGILELQEYSFCLIIRYFRW